jgi:peptidoglycan/LPS O-acetylase OafA/YrhL
VLAVYIAILQVPSELDKWMRMKAALPYFLTFNNDIPLLLMPERVGITFGLSWTLGIEEKFYLVWPLVCFIILNSTRTRLTAAVAIYLMTLAGAIFCFPMGRAYAGLVVGAILAILLSGNNVPLFKDAVRKFPPGGILALLIVGFVLVDVDKRLVFVFSWTVFLLVASLVLKPSSLSRGLTHPVLVWFGKRSYAMYLIQGFAIRAVELTLKPNSILEQVFITLGSFGLASLGAALLHVCIEEPARKLGRTISAKRSRHKFLLGVGGD